MWHEVKSLNFSNRSVDLREGRFYTATIEFFVGVRVAGVPCLSVEAVSCFFRKNPSSCTKVINLLHFWGGTGSPRSTVSSASCNYCTFCLESELHVYLYLSPSVVIHKLATFPVKILVLAIK